jgi:hypothetical protein
MGLEDEAEPAAALDQHILVCARELCTEQGNASLLHPTRTVYQCQQGGLS